MYKICLDPHGGSQSGIKRLADNAFIPMAEDNSDYQQYLKWLEQGNTPLPADTPEAQA